MPEFATYADFFAQSPMARFRHQSRTAGRWPVRLLRIEQDAHEDEDVATDELVIGLVLGGRAGARWSWSGRGKWNETPARRPGQIGVTPLRTSGLFQTFGPSRMMVVCLPLAGLQEQVGEHALDFGRLHDRYAELPSAVRLCHELWRAAARSGSVADDRIEATAAALVQSLLRSARPGDEKRAAAPLSPQEAARVEAFARAGPPQTLSVADLAAVIGLPVPVFRSRFRATFGLRPHAYLLERRLEAARDRLLRGKAPISAIALDLGFADQAHFTTAFGRHFGVTPAVVRRDARSKQHRQRERSTHDRG
jgi:AraC family transcriptional regulator